jgi:hypothetical protein
MDILSTKATFSPFKPPALNLIYILLIVSLNILVKDLSIPEKTKG